jgi:hypothetical protein
MIWLDVWGPLPYTESKYRYCRVAKYHFSKITIPILIVAVGGQPMCEFMITVIGHFGPLRRVFVDVRHYLACNALAIF